MRSPYLPLFDHTDQMSPEEKFLVGLTTASLLVGRQAWVHRRVELLTFEDHNVIRRRNSIDFTFPRWASQMLGMRDSKSAEIAVPLALVRKGTLVHFNLRDEREAAVPLLSGVQVGRLAEMALLATARLVLPTDEVPSWIAKDIRQVARDRRRHLSNDEKGRPSGVLEQLFSPAQPYPHYRALLKKHEVFLPLAEAFDRNYMAAVLLKIKGGERRVIHFAYDEMLDDTGDERANRRNSTRRKLMGQSQQVLVSASSAGDAASFHSEAESPEGLIINSRETLFGDELDRMPDGKVGNFQRSHVHYLNLPPGSQLAIVLSISPRSSTIIRGAALISALTLLAVLYARLRLPEIVTSHSGGAVAALLIVPTLLSIWVSRPDEHPATTYLLWPIRIMATTPGILAFMAAGVLASGGTNLWSKITLGTLIGLLGFVTAILMLSWYRAADAQRRKP
jgi:hypothetical protein